MKAILLIDEMPNNCLDCPCSFVAKDIHICEALEDVVLSKNNMENERPSWCPLKPMPKSMPYEQTDTQTVKAVKIDNGFRLGWNACLKEIEEKSESHIQD